MLMLLTCKLRYLFWCLEFKFTKILINNVFLKTKYVMYRGWDSASGLIWVGMYTTYRFMLGFIEVSGGGSFFCVYGPV